MDRTESACRVWWDEDLQIAHADWQQGAVCDLAAAQAISAELMALGHGRIPVLVDMRGLAKFERAAREHFISDDEGARAVALLVGSAVSKMIANFFIGMKRLPVPIQMFTDRVEAVDWLEQQP